MTSEEVKNKLKFLRFSIELIESKRRESNRLKGQYAKSEGGLKEELKRQYQAVDSDVHRLFTERQKILDAIEQMDDPLARLVIQYYYIDGLKWKNIARIVNASERLVYTARDTGIENLKDILQ